MPKDIHFGIPLYAGEPAAYDANRPSAAGESPGEFLRQHIASAPDRGRQNDRVEQAAYRVAVRHRTTRRWISMNDMALLYSEQKGQAGQDGEALYRKGLEHLQDALIRGAFDRQRRTLVLQLAGRFPPEEAGTGPLVFTGLLDSQRYRELARESKPRGTPPWMLAKIFLSHCWLPYHLARQWLEDHDVKAPSYWFLMEPLHGPSQVEAAESSRKRSRKPGPKPGDVARFDKSDQAAYPEFEALRRQQFSATEAARRLARDGTLKGAGTVESTASRFRKRYAADKVNSI